MVDLKLIKVGAVTLGGLAILTIVVLAILVGFDKPVMTLTSAELNVTLGDTNGSTAVGTTAQYPYLTTLTCQNATGVLTSYNTTLYTRSEGDYNGGFILPIEGPGGAGSEHSGSPVDCDITYYAATEASNATRDFITALRIFATFSGVVAIGLMGYALFFMVRGNKKNELV